MINNKDFWGSSLQLKRNITTKKRNSTNINKLFTMGKAGNIVWNLNQNDLNSRNKSNKNLKINASTDDKPPIKETTNNKKEDIIFARVYQILRP